MTQLQDLLRVLELEPAGEGAWKASSVDFGSGTVVYGGQLLAQAIIAGAAVDPTKQVKSIHTVFARGASVAVPLEISVEVIQKGRTFASAAVAVSQAERQCMRSLLLLDAPDDDLITHQTEMPASMVPGDSLASAHGAGYWEMRIVDGVDLADADATGPAVLDVWTRFPGAPDDATISKALLAFATDGFLIGTAMRPHAGIGQSMAHRSIDTNVITHTLSFHRPVKADGWMLLRHESPVAGRGRSYGRAHVYSEDGELVASFVQENMIRAFPTKE